MDNSRNNEQNKNINRDLRDNFKNIQEFNTQNYDGNSQQDNQNNENRELQDNFKSIQELINYR